ncbi:MAG TPA: MotA/TolQ/ExbB proton channel family protein [Mariprofundaceae bacterium]|nr:MotA/TolQ/ExbB proton channel family protein [Mariprofundaceae bacterium]
MNRSTVLGIVFGLMLIIGSIFLSAVDPGVYVNGPGLLIVLGGTIAATLVSYPMQEVRRVLRVLGYVLHHEEYSIRKDVAEIAHAARLRMRGDFARIEDQLDRIHNPFLRTAIQLVVDETPQEEVVNILNWRIARLRERERAEAQIFHTMSTYAPAFGMFGTLVGMVNMLYSINGPDLLNTGHNMAVALMTTLYGLILSNLIFKPVAIKLERRTETRVLVMHMIVEGTVLLVENRSPGFISETLKSFVAQHDDELKGARKYEDELREPNLIGSKLRKKEAEEGIGEQASG